MKTEFKLNEAVTHVNYPELMIGQVIHVSPDNKHLKVRWNPLGVESIRIYMQGSKSLSHDILAKPTHSEPKLEAATMSLNAQQKRVLVAIYKAYLQQRPGYLARTPAIAHICGENNSVMSKVGLELRNQGLVASTNDGSDYNYWTLSVIGKATAMEISNVPQPKGLSVREFIVWSPEGKTCPSVIHGTRSEAANAATEMAKKYPGQTFRVCGVLEGYKLNRKAKPVEYTETLEIV